MVIKYRASEYAKYDHEWPTATVEIKGIVDWFAGGDSYLAVCLKRTGKLIGFVALNPDEGDGGVAFNLGYVFHTDYHGQGYATEACRAALDHAFDHLQAQRVVTSTAAANRASCRLLRRLGFSKTSESRGSFRNAPDGTPIRFVAYTYALARDRWRRGDEHRAG